MIVVTTGALPGRSIAAPLGLVRGSTVRAKHVGSDVVAGFRRLVGGEVREYSQMMAAAREQAFDRMVARAEAMGADAIVAARFETAQISLNACEVLAYGTAVRLAP